MDEDEDFQSMPAREERRFVGELSRGDIAIPVVFHAHIRGDGELVLRFEPFANDAQSHELERRWLDDNVTVGLHGLRGVAEGGARFETTELVVSSFNPRWEHNGPHTFRPNVKFQRASLHTPTVVADRPIRRIWVKGFECYPEMRTPSPLGEVLLWGAGRLADPDVITGAMEVTGGEAIEDMDAWMKQSEALLWHIRSIMSFAASVTLRAPLSETHIGGEVEIVCRSQMRQARPTMQSFHKLNLQPALDAAVSSFFEPSGAKGLGLAIEWMAQDSTYNEIRLISAMTALEHLLDVNLDDADTFILPEEEFAALRKTVANALTDIGGEAIAKPHLNEMKGKMGELNRRALRRKIEILVAKWQVPMQGIHDKRMQDALNARNKVVHTGRHEKALETDPSLWDHVTVVRELVVRIILRALGFRGEYITYLDGARRAQFPPAT